MSLLKPYSGVLTVLHRAVDAGLISLALYAASTFTDVESSARSVLALATGIVAFLFVAEARRLYASWRLRSLDEEFGNVFATWAITCAILIVAAFMLKVSADFSRRATATWFLTTPFLLLSSRLVVRLLLRRLRAQGKNIRTVAVAGAGKLSETIVQQLEETETFGVRLAGVYDDRSLARHAESGHDASRLAGTLEDLMARAKRGDFDYIFIALPMRAEQRIIKLTQQLADTTASVYVVPDLFVFDLMRAHWVTLGGISAVSIYETPFDGVNGWLKRAEDLVLGTTALAIAVIPMLAIAIGVRLTTPGSIIFRQRRYGLGGKQVEVWKFRTMTSSDDGATVAQARSNDARVTPFGKFLRSTSLDELPQLFNVLGGGMSLVGPRPHAVAHNEQYRRLIHGYMLRHKVKPGITGWAQVNGWRGETDTLEKMQMRVQHDLEYLQNWSLWLDLKILAKTIVVVLSRKNAY